MYYILQHLQYLRISCDKCDVTWWAKADGPEPRAYGDVFLHVTYESRLNRDVVTHSNNKEIKVTVTPQRKAIKHTGS